MAQQVDFSAIRNILIECTEDDIEEKKDTLRRAFAEKLLNDDDDGTKARGFLIFHIIEVPSWLQEELLQAGFTLQNHKGNKILIRWGAVK